MRNRHTPQSSEARPVLIVERDAARREHLARLLGRHGLSVLAVPSGEQALELLKHDQPALILVDVRLSDISGWDLAHRIREFDTHLPILLLGNGHPPFPGSSTAMEIQAILPSEVSPTALLQEVDRWLHPSPPPTTPRQPRWPGLILVVDDEPKLRDILQGFLELHGFRVAQAGSGEEALEQARRLEPTVVLLDVKMPGMDGLTTLRQLKALRPGVTVIMATAFEEEEAMEEALALGAEDYILKPVNAEYLETILLSKILLGKAP